MNMFVSKFIVSLMDLVLLHLFMSPLYCEYNNPLKYVHVRFVLVLSLLPLFNLLCLIHMDNLNIAWVSQRIKFLN